MGGFVAILTTLFGIYLILLVLWEGFETIVLPRRVTRSFRLTRLIYRLSWIPWANLVRKAIPARQQETWLSVFGPLSLLLLLTIWACGLIIGYALLHWALGAAVLTENGDTGFLTDLYMSGTTFFTLGMGDALPRSDTARLLVILEAGMAFGFLALVIGYLPALNQTFSQREVSISLLDARAGSPPTAFEMLRRHGHARGMEALQLLLHEWEHWAAEFLEGHLSYPVLAYFRSQHENQSWLGALTAVLDTCALVMAGVEGACERQAELTFAMARHALVDLSLVFKTRPFARQPERLSPERLAAMRAALATAGIKLHKGEAADRRLSELRRQYEPYVEALASYFRVSVPPWRVEEPRPDNWQTSNWEMADSSDKPARRGKDEHFRG
jgi:hypothetical protein